MARCDGCITTLVTRVLSNMVILACCMVMLATLVLPAHSSTAAIPLWPCYSVHKLPNVTDPFEFRYVGVANCDCMYTLEGPQGSTLTLQLHGVFLEALPYGYYDDCSRGAVRVFNFAATGALVLADTVCSTIESANPLTTDTNLAVVTSNVHRGQFLLRVTVNPAPPSNVTDLVPPSLIGSTTSTTVAPAAHTTTRRAHLANLVVTEPVVHPSTMVIQAEMLVQEKEDNQVNVVEDEIESESTTPTTTTEENPLEDVSTNLIG